MKLKAFFFAAVIAALGPLSAQSSGNPSSWSIMAAPSVFVPLVSGSMSANGLFSTSWGGSLDAEYKLPPAIPLSLRLGAGYSAGGLLPVGDIPVKGSLTEATLKAGAVLCRNLAPALTFRTFFDVGVSYGTLPSNVSAAYAVAQLGAGLDFLFAKTLSARIDTAFLYKAGLAGGIGAVLGLKYDLPLGNAARSGPAKPRQLELFSVDIASVFPSLRFQYDENPVGTVKITNIGKETVKDVKVGFLIKQYMDAPTDSPIIPNLEPGASIEVPLYALFNDSILGITEATKVTGEVFVDYNGDMEQSRTATVVVYDRNALTWSDDRKAAAFVSSKDPWVLDLAGNIMAAVMADRNQELNKNFQTAIAVHEGLKVYGISYMLSPNRPFAKAVVDPEVVDSLKYPRQSLGYRAGDCADLSVLYASLFEAAGIETAFVTIPGHIFMAINLGLTVEQAKTRSIDLGEFIVQNDKVWLPIETTIRDAGFIEVWHKAASEWRDATAASVSAFYPIHEAWSLYAPVGLPADNSTIAPPPKADVNKYFKIELAKAVDSELSMRISALGPVPEKGPAFIKSANDRGVLYAKYGFYADAIKYFETAVKEGSSSALVNLGNIAILKADPSGAYDYYRQASKKLPENAKLLVNLAKAASALGKADEATGALKQVRKLDPTLADQYAWVAQTGATGNRAANAEDTGPLWF